MQANLSSSQDRSADGDLKRLKEGPQERPDEHTVGDAYRHLQHKLIRLERNRQNCDFVRQDCSSDF